MSILLTFPGQGPHHSGMISALPKSEAVDRALSDVEEALGFSPYRFDLLDEKSSNGDVQLAMTIISYVQFKLLESIGVKFDYMMGLSIGAFGAAICSGMFSLKDGLSVVFRRGELMSGAYPHGYSMAAIIGLSNHEVKMLVSDANEKGFVVYISNINTENTTIISGSFEALDYTCELAIKNHAHSANRINVSVPSHCELLKPQAEELYEILKDVPINKPYCGFVSTNRARVLRNIEEIRTDLAFNMANTVYLSETLAMMSQRGVKLAIEAAPGSVLTRLCQGAMPETQCLSMETTKFEHIAQWIN